jgi:GT2 family glycosyltransferase
MTTPFFSIIVPTFDRPEALTACVQAIKKLDYPQDRFEVIIVDDGSSVPIKPFDQNLRDVANITILRQINTGPASARNTGAQQAKGDILAFTDDDCMPTPQWLRELARSFNDNPLGLVGGRTVNGLVDNLYSTASQMIVEEAYAFFLSRDSDLRFFASNNMAVAARLFHKIGGFDSSFRTSEDREFCDRWIRQGHPLVYVPQAIVFHHHHLTMTTFIRQHFYYGCGAYRFHRARAQRGSRILKPDPQFYVSVCRRALFSASSRKSLRMAGLLGLWQAANLFGFLWQAAHQNLFSANSASSDKNQAIENQSRGGPSSS